jgi:hypothetical protein
MIDTIHEYVIPPHTRISRCRLRIYTQDGRHAVVLTEIAENQGMSITNAAEDLATEIRLVYGLNPSTTAWIEHYTPDSYRERSGRAETFDLVTFTWDNAGAARYPKWRRLTIEEVETTTGATWAHGNPTDDTNQIAESLGLEWVQDDWEEM